MEADKSCVSASDSLGRNRLAGIKELDAFLAFKTILSTNSCHSKYQFERAAFYCHSRQVEEWEMLVKAVDVSCDVS